VLCFFQCAPYRRSSRLFGVVCREVLELKYRSAVRLGGESFGLSIRLVSSRLDCAGGLVVPYSKVYFPAVGVRAF